MSLIYALGALLVVPCAEAQQAAATPVLLAMRQELARSLADFKGQPTPPYFLSYEITETRTVSVRGSNGALHHDADRRWRALDVDLRLGSAGFDNTHPIRGMPSFDFMGFGGSSEVPLDDSAAAIRRVLGAEHGESPGRRGERQQHDRRDPRRPQ